LKENTEKQKINSRSQNQQRREKRGARHRPKEVAGTGKDRAYLTALRPNADQERMLTPQIRRAGPSGASVPGSLGTGRRGGPRVNFALEKVMKSQEATNRGSISSRRHKDHHAQEDKGECKGNKVAQGMRPSGLM